MLSEEVCRVKGESGEKVRVLEGRVQEQTERLKVYQQVETDMDDVILQAAQGQHNTLLSRQVLYCSTTVVKSIKFKKMGHVGSPTCINSTGDKIGIPDGWVTYWLGDAATSVLPLRRHTCTNTSPILSQRSPT